MEWGNSRSEFPRAANRRGFIDSVRKIGELSSILWPSPWLGRVKHFIDHIVCRCDDADILQSTEQAHGRDQVKIWWSVKHSQTYVLEQDRDGLIGLEIAFKASFVGDEVDHREFSGVLLEFLPKPTLLSFALTYVCPLDHERWGITIDEIFNFGIFLGVGRIAGQFVIDGIYDNNAHIQFK